MSMNYMFLLFVDLKNFGHLWFFRFIYNVLKILFGGVKVIYILSQSLLDVLHISFPVKSLELSIFFSIIVFKFEIFLFNLSSPLKFKEVSIFSQ